MKNSAVIAGLILMAVTAYAGQQADNIPTISNKTDGMQKLEGFFNLYWEEAAERMWMEIDEWDEFLYVVQLPGSFEGRNRGSWGGSRVVRFERYGSKVFLRQSNYRYRAISDDSLERRDVADAYTAPTIFGFRVAAEEGGRVLVDATEFFMRDAQNLDMGGLDKNRSAFYWPRTKNFPKNTEVELLLTYQGAPAANTGQGRAPADRRSRAGSGTGTTVRMHHSIVELPDNQYKPRRYDPRAGVMSSEYWDYSSPFHEPIRKQHIARFRLEKNNPNAPVSEAVKPIVYYVDNGVPEPIRSALVEGASWWNQAFEAAGFKNAFQVRVLPPDADPMDLRYNMILWIHRPSRGWSSGGSISDPRTGEIISGRVFLGSQRIRQDFLIGSALKALYAGEEPETREIEEMALARIRQLSAHEVGHTLGYGHNYASSVFNRASVMDYPHPLVKIRNDGTLDFSDAYGVGIGEWDKVFVAYSYSHFPEGTDENEALDKILNDAHAKGMYCLSDSGAGGAHPYVHDWDNGPDALTELERIMKIRRIALNNFSENNIPLGTPLSRLEEVLVPVYLFHRYQTQAVSKSLGGVDYRIALRGDGQKTVQVVAPDVQRRALKLLLDTASVNALELPLRVLRLITPRSGVRGGEVFPRRTAPTFDPLSTAETAANFTMGLVFNPARAERLLANRALNEQAPSLNEVVDTVLSRTWKAEPPGGAYSSEVHRVVDNMALFHLMALAANAGASPQVRAIASLKIDQLEDWLKERLPTQSDESQLAHYKFAVIQIERYQADPTNFVVPTPQPTPRGAPIGTVDFPFPGIVWDSREPVIDMRVP